MLSYRVLDHCLVSADDKRRLRDEQEEPDRFERIDSGRWQTPIKIVNQHHELIDFGFIEKFGILPRNSWISSGMCLASAGFRNDFASSRSALISSGFIPPRGRPTSQGCSTN